MKESQSSKVQPCMTEQQIEAHTLKKIRNKPDFISHVHVDRVGLIIFNFHSTDNTADFGSEINVSQKGRMYLCLFYF